MKVCLLNDSYPPAFDGVNTTVINYGKELSGKGHKALLVVPAYPGSEDYPCGVPLAEYPCFPFGRLDSYRFGNFLSAKAVRSGRAFAPDVIHCHCPLSSMMVAKRLRRITGAPLVLTYHTKVSYEIPRLAKTWVLRRILIWFCVRFANQSDEVWCVCEDAAKDLRKLGYRGDITLMPNGTDMPRGKTDEEEIKALKAEYGISQGVPLYLFVGRMIRYKGQDMILEALSRLMAEGREFRMIFVGDGSDRSMLEEKAVTLGIADRCIFTGIISDRNRLRVLYSAADLFLLPSAYDNAPITVREALACACPSVLIKGSGSAEGFTDGRTAFLIDNSVESLTAKLREIGCDIPLLSRVGEAAMNELYLSWSDAVEQAIERYRYVKQKTDTEAGSDI